MNYCYCLFFILILKFFGILFNIIVLFLDFNELFVLVIVIGIGRSLCFKIFFKLIFCLVLYVIISFCNMFLLVLRILFFLIVLMIVLILYKELNVNG